MRYIVCITVGLPGVGKTCLKFLLMGEPPPELRNSTICAETPIKIEIQLRAISDIKLRASGEQWIEVDNERMLEIVARMIILVSEQHPESRRFRFQETSDDHIREVVQGGEAEHCSEMESEKENPLSRFVRWITTPSHKKTYPKPEDSYDANLPAAVAHPQPNVPSEACQTAVSAIMAKLVQIISRLRNEKPGEGSVQPSGIPLCKIPESIWVYLSDCGGQPQYHELLPLFVRHISAALCVLRLPDQLDKVQAVEYYSENQRLGVAQQSQLSAKDTIRCLVNTIQSFATEGQKPNIILVGTHRDLLEEKVKQASAVGESSPPQAPSTDSTSSPVESLEDKNQQLLEMLEPEFSDQLVYHSKDMKQLLFPLNTLNPEEVDKAKARVVRKAVENSPAQEVEVPIWWYILEQLLQELAKQLERKVLSKAECLEIANMLGFMEKALEAALRFFDELNVIKYSPEVLPNVVFTDSQVPLDKVSELVRESYLLRGDTSVKQSNSDSTPGEGKWKHFRDHGVVNQELMKKFPSHYVPGIFTINDLSELLKAQLVFAPVPTPDWAMPRPGSPPPTNPPGPHFVMPASLVTLSEAELAKQRTPSPIAAALLVKFPQGSRRAGVFCCFAVHLIRHCGWELLLDAKVPLFRNCIKFCLKKTSPPCTVTVIDSNLFIEVYANVSKQATASQCARILPIVKGSIFGGIAAACRALKYRETYPDIGFTCPHHEANSSSASKKPKLHSASVSHHNEFWCCDDDTSVSGLLQSCHHIWFGTGMFHVTLLGTRGCSFLIFNDDVYFTVLEDGTTSASPRATSLATCTSSEGE